MVAYLFWGILCVLLYLILRDQKYIQLIRKGISQYLILFIVVFFVFAVILFPDDSVDAAYRGLAIWLTVVLPALLPFFIGTELLIGLGVVRFVGTLLEPFMRPLFHVPGEGSFAFTMSMTSGYPVGAKIVSRLREEQHLTPREAQRLLSFSNTSGPLFLVGAVGVGMFQSTEIGFLLALSHYLGAICTGLLFRLLIREPPLSYKPTMNPRQILRKAFSSLKGSRKNTPSFGILLGQAVKEALNTILLVGGFIILFSVLIEILKRVGLIGLLTGILTPLGTDQLLVEAILVGMFEITNGSQLIAALPHISLYTKILCTAFIIGWSGLSIHAQVLSLFGENDIRTPAYFAGKLCHAGFSTLLAGAGYLLFNPILSFSSPASSINQFRSLGQLTYNLKLSAELFVLVLLFLILFSLTMALVLSLLSLLPSRRR